MPPSGASLRSPMRYSAILGTFLSTLILHAAPALGASFNFGLSVPIQCGNMTVSVQGGVPPYQLIIIPVGTQTPEYRHIINMNLTEGVTEQTFQLAYPTNTQFVAVMNDATGVGTGGTGVATTVAASQDDSCLVETTSPAFYFFMAPQGYLSQCQDTNLSWKTVAPNNAEGDVTFYGVIPGGQTFLISPKTQPYVWNVPVRAGTSVTLFAGDSRGIGSGGSVGPYVVNGTDSSCINAQSPSSTAGSPAGQVTQSSSTSSGSGSKTSSGGRSTSTSGSGGGGGGGSKSHTGAIVGGVVGGVMGLSIIAGLLFFFCCIKRKRRKEEEREAANRPTVDLTGDDDEPGTPPSRSGPPMIEAGFYHPEPFVVPEVGSSRPSTEAGHGTRAGTSLDLTSNAPSSNSGRPDQRRERRISQNTLNSLNPTTVMTPTTGRGRKGPPPSAMRATNFVQHEDAGVVPPAAPTGEEVVELPPAYGSVKPKGATAARTTATTTDGEGSSPDATS